MTTFWLLNGSYRHIKALVHSQIFLALQYIFDLFHNYIYIQLAEFLERNDGTVNQAIVTDYHSPKSSSCWLPVACSKTSSNMVCNSFLMSESFFPDILHLILLDNVYLWLHSSGRFFGFSSQKCRASVAHWIQGVGGCLWYSAQKQTRS